MMPVTLDIFHSGFHSLFFSFLIIRMCAILDSRILLIFYSGFKNAISRGVLHSPFTVGMAGSGPSVLSPEFPVQVHSHHFTETENYHGKSEEIVIRMNNDVSKKNSVCRSCAVWHRRLWINFEKIHPASKG